MTDEKYKMFSSILECCDCR